MKLPVKLLPGQLCIVRLPADRILPGLPAGAGFFSMTRTPTELSIVADSSRVREWLPTDARIQEGYRAICVDTVLDFSLVGILSRMTAALAEGKIPVFVISTFDTDYILVPADEAERAMTVLSGLS